MIYSFSTNAFVSMPLPAAIRQIAACGYGGVEILADSPHLFADEAVEDQLAQTEKVLAETGLKVANINANTAMGYYGRTFWEPLFEPSLANPDRRARHWRIGYTKRCIEIAARLGSPCVSVTAGRSVSGIKPEDSLGLLVDSLNWLLDHAEGRGVKLAVEYEPGLLVENAAELVALLGRIGSPFLGANLDIGHSRVAGESVPETAALLGNRIFHIHLEDIRGRKHYHLIPGEGEIDFDQVLASLEQVGYDGFVTVELYTHAHAPGEAAERSLRFLEKIHTNPWA